MTGTLYTTASWPRALLRYAALRGLHREDVLTASGVASTGLSDDESRVPFATLSGLYRQISRSLAEPDVLLRALEAEPQPWALGLVGFLARCSRDFGHALATAARFFPLVLDGIRVEIDVSDSRATLTATCDAIDAPATWFESLFGSLAVLAGQITAGDHELLCVSLQGPELYAAPSRDRIFACPVVFEHATNSMTFAPSSLRVTNRRADPALWGFLHARAERGLAALVAAEDLSSSLRRMLRDSIKTSAVPSIDACARRMRTSSRSLQRSLAREGINFSSLVEDIVRERALLLVGRAALPLKEIAPQLGFATASSFGRAFRRWTGLSPLDYRKRAATGVAPRDAMEPLDTVASWGAARSRELRQ